MHTVEQLWGGNIRFHFFPQSCLLSFLYNGHNDQIMHIYFSSHPGSNDLWWVLLHTALCCPLNKCTVSVNMAYAIFVYRWLKALEAALYQVRPLIYLAYYYLPWLSAYLFWRSLSLFYLTGDFCKQGLCSTTQLQLFTQHILVLV